MIKTTVNATNALTRKTPKRPELKMSIPNSCPWILNSGKRCNQSHAPASCDPSQWKANQVWRTIYAMKMCPLCLNTGHISQDCPNRNRGPCNRTKNGGEKCQYYHHYKLCTFPFHSFKEYNSGSGNQRRTNTYTTTKGPRGQRSNNQRAKGRRTVNRSQAQGTQQRKKTTQRKP